MAESGEGVMSATEAVVTPAAESTANVVSAETPAVAPETKVPVEAPKPEDKFASKFAALTRQERELQKRRVELKAQEQSVQGLKEVERLLREDPLKFLEKYGHSYEKLTEMELKRGSKPSVEEEVLSLKRKLEEKEEFEKQAKVEDAKRLQEQTVQQFKTELQTFVDSAPEEYEYIRFHEEEGVDLMYNVVEAHFEQTNRILSPKEAADLVEKHLEEHWASKLPNVKKLKSKFIPDSDSLKKAEGEESSKPSEDPEAEPRSKSMTLTNRQQTEVLTPKTSRRLNDDESKEYSASLLRWSE